MATHEDYRSVQALDAADQRILLADGDSAERLWAAWALATRLAAEAAPTLVGYGSSEPDAGQRRQLAVIAAGLGEAGILRALAQNDPSPRVRATACQHLIGTSGGQRADVAEFVRFCLFADSEPLVREEILRWSRPDLPPLAIDELVRLAHDRAPGVRRWAAALVESRFPADAVAGSGLLEWLDGETELALLVDLARLAMKCRRPGRVLQAAEVQEGPRRLALLDLLVGRDLRFEWTALEALAALRDDAVDERLAALVDRRPNPVAFAWLVHAIASRANADRIAHWRFLDACWSLIGDMVGSMPPQLVPAIQADLSTVLRQVEDEASGRAFATEESRRSFFVGLRRQLLGLVETAGRDAG